MTKSSKNTVDYTVIVTAWKEPDTVKKVIQTIVDPDWNKKIANSEVLVACPDIESWESALQIAKKYKYSNIKRVEDKAEGKAKALNMSFKKSKWKDLNPYRWRY